MHCTCTYIDTIYSISHRGVCLEITIILLFLDHPIHIHYESFCNKLCFSYTQQTLNHNYVTIGHPILQLIIQFFNSCCCIHFGSLIIALQNRSCTPYMSSGRGLSPSPTCRRTVCCMPATSDLRYLLPLWRGQITRQRNCAQLVNSCNRYTRPVTVLSKSCQRTELYPAGSTQLYVMERVYMCLYI